MARGRNSHARCGALAWSPAGAVLWSMAISSTTERAIHMKRLLAALLATGFFTGPGWAQDGGVWLQVEALPTLNRAENRAEYRPGHA